MTMLQAALVGYVLIGMLGFSAWSIYVFTTSALPAGADWTTRAVFYTGQALVWLAIVALAGGIAALAARGVTLAVTA